MLSKPDELKSSKKKLSIRPVVIEKYNKEFGTKIEFLSLDALESLRKKYREVNGLPAFLHHTMKGRPTPDADLILKNSNLCTWTEDDSFLIIPNIYTSYETLLKDPISVKDSEYELDLVAWWVAPALLKKYGFSKKSGDEKRKESFQDFLQTQLKTKSIYPGYQCLHRSDSQEKIGELETKNPGSRYLASILDLTPDHLPILENLKKTCLDHLEKTYGVKLEEDLVEIYIHFPYPEKHTTLHVHIRVNVGRHPMEKARSFSLDEIIACLKSGKPIAQLILERTPYFTDDFDILHEIPGVILKQSKNPYIIPLTSKTEKIIVPPSPTLQTDQEKKDSTSINLNQEKVDEKTMQIIKVDKDSPLLFPLPTKAAEKSQTYTSYAVL